MLFTNIQIRPSYIYCLGLLLMSTFSSMAEGPLIDNYVESYKEIAIAEMHRSGIPASIKLAQGLLESDFGRSDLANKANNHFGIKCGSKWTGDTFYKEDDDRNKDGKLIPSCFRAYANAYESYMAHSDFLMDPRKSYRYGFLFNYSSRDYSSWAHGLKDAGYATDPTYPSKLIQLIENNGLHRFDEDIYGDDVLVADRQTEISIEEKIEKETQHSEKDIIVSISDAEEGPNDGSSSHVPLKINGSKALRLGYKDTALSLAKANQVSLRSFMAFNEFLEYPADSIAKGTLVFLDAKQRDYLGLSERHVVKKGETMQDIAHEYGIWLKELHIKNRIPQDAQPLVGETLVLNGLVKIRKRPKFKRLNEVLDESEEYLFDTDMASLR